MVLGQEWFLSYLLLWIQVQVLAGQDKGKNGKVVVVDYNFNRLYVQGLNTVRCSGWAELA